MKSIQHFKFGKFLGILVIILFMLSGCSNSNTSDRDHFVNKLTIGDHGQRTKYDPELIKSHSLSTLEIVDSSGGKIQIDFSKQPVVFSAHWCSACQRELVLLNKNKEGLNQVPIIISTGFENKTLNDAVRITTQEMTELEITGFTVYYTLKEPEIEDVPEYPGLVFPKNGSLYRLNGEHTIDNIKKALND